MDEMEIKSIVAKYHKEISFGISAAVTWAFKKFGALIRRVDALETEVAQIKKDAAKEESRVDDHAKVIKSMSHDVVRLQIKEQLKDELEEK